MNHYSSRSNDFDQYVVSKQAPLLDYLLETLKGSRSKIKATLQGRGIKVNGKVVTQFDFVLQPGMKLAVSKSKRNDKFKSRYVKLIYEDQYLVVIEKNVGILSMAAGHSSLNVKKLLDEWLPAIRRST